MDALMNDEDPRVTNLIAFLDQLIRESLPPAMTLALAQVNIDPAQRARWVGMLVKFMAILDKGPDSEEAGLARVQMQQLLRSVDPNTQSILQIGAINFYVKKNP